MHILAATSPAPRPLRRSSLVASPLHAGPVQGGRGLILGQDDDRAFGHGVADGALQGGADGHQQVTQPVDQPRPVLADRLTFLRTRSSLGTVVRRACPTPFRGLAGVPEVGAA